MINLSAFTLAANKAKAKSLSITPSTPSKPSAVSIVGIPPPPPQITQFLASTDFLIPSIPMKLTGFGLGTTLRYPLPASSTIVEPGFAASAASLVV